METNELLGIDSNKSKSELLEERGILRYIPSAKLTEAKNLSGLTIFNFMSQITIFFIQRGYKKSVQSM